MPTDITKTTQSRVFMTESKSSPAVAPVFQSCLVLGGVSQSFGDREPIYCQDPYTVGKFKTVGYTTSAPESVESSLSGRFMATARSNLIRVAKAGAPVDLHVHVSQIGSNPSTFAGWQTKIVFEGVRFSSLDIDELGSHEEDTVINHSVDFAADNWYQLSPLVFSERAINEITKAVKAVAIHYNGDLTKPPAERVIMLAGTIAAGGSPSTPPDLLYSLDSGSTWYAFDIDTAASTDNITGMVVLGEHVALFNDADGEIHYTPLAGLDGVNVPVWSTSTAGQTATYEPRCGTAVGGVAFIGGAKTAVYKTSNISAGLTAMGGQAFSGAATVNAIAAIDEDNIVAVGNSNLVMKCADGTNFEILTGPEPGQNLNAVAMLSSSVFLVGTANGKLYYTTNAGLTWTLKEFSGSGSGVIQDIKFATSLIGFLSHTLSGAGRIFMTTDGGYSWSMVPSTGLAAYTDAIYAIGVQRDEPAIVLLGGLADDGSDGVIIVGESTD